MAFLSMKGIPANDAEGLRVPCKVHFVLVTPKREVYVSYPTWQRVLIKFMIFRDIR